MEVRLTKPRVGRNPNQPGSSFVIPARATVKFKAGKVMRQLVSERSASMQSVAAEAKAAEAKAVKPKVIKPKALKQEPVAPEPAPIKKRTAKKVLL